MKLSEDENRIPASSKISDIDKNSLGMPISFQSEYFFVLHCNIIFIMFQNKEMH